mmetsp:Transcript_43768/g.93064  ORF Transcript_43768/g.93064 Transcript_43768/m.93064 type:complete len:141 (+) Transcript_43768:319-741(+)
MYTFSGPYNISRLYCLRSMMSLPSSYCRGCTKFEVGSHKDVFLEEEELILEVTILNIVCLFKVAIFLDFLLLLLVGVLHEIYLLRVALLQVQLPKVYVLLLQSCYPSPLIRSRRRRTMTLSSYGSLRSPSSRFTWMLPSS